MPPSATLDVQDILSWLMREGPRLASPAALLERYSAKLREAGLQVDRSTLGAPVLHPVARSSFVFWELETGSEQRWFIYSPEQLKLLEASPIQRIYTQGEATSLRLDLPEERDRFPIGEDLWSEGYHQYEALPLEFSDGTFKVLTLATKSPAGFDNGQLDLVRTTLPALTLVFEGHIARNTAKTLMETYVGTRAGLRVLNGEIARGDGSPIDAVIWFSDLRGFTSLAQSRGEAELLQLLNSYFGAVTDAIEAQSGEVLKFIGDAVLAIFPFEGDLHSAVHRAETAALQLLQSTSLESGLSFGIALHPGRVFYGNIGGGTRLDFTVIGASVNLASRIEGLCALLDHPLLASADFVNASSLTWLSQGRHRLKGVAEPVEVFAPVQPTLQTAT